MGQPNALDGKKILPIALKTLDGEVLAGMFYDVVEPKGAVVFVHMMPATKESWASLAELFASRGFVGLAIDLRGHGESEGGPDGYKKFTDEDHQKSILDVDAAVKYLLGKGFPASQIVLVGASIGANLALKYMGDHNDFKTAALLSAGLDYRGIHTESAARALSDGARVLLVSSRDDGDNAAENETLAATMPATVEKKLNIYDKSGHGTQMLERESGLAKLIVDFVL